MNIAYISKATGLEIKAGDSLVTDNGTFVVERWDSYTIRLVAGGWCNPEFCHCTRVEYPEYWLMNRRTGKPVKIGDTVGSYEVIGIHEDNTSVYLAGYGRYHAW